MEALILSCGTGGGHNAAGYAIKEALEKHGHGVTMMDPYSLAAPTVSRAVNGSYVHMAQKTPRLFGMVYSLGNGYRRLPVRSPVYEANKLMRRRMTDFLSQHHFDAVFMPHLYPAEILTYLKRKGIAVPKMFFIATDYVCIPFTEELDCDYYVIPGKALAEDFVRRKIDPDKLVSLGIPVSSAFRQEISRQEAAQALGLDPKIRYLVLCGGSMGGGKMERTMRILHRYLQMRPDTHLIVICGSNSQLQNDLLARYGEDPRYHILGKTNQMALYMKLCAAFITKPGGLTTTEAAVAGAPLIHVTPIPGCENYNMEYFAKTGMSLCVGNRISLLPKALDALLDPETVRQVISRQREHINPEAAEDICRLAEQTVAERKCGT